MYESRNLVKYTSKNKYGHLLYDSEMVKRMIVIRYFQKIGVTLPEIQCLFESNDIERAEMTTNWFAQSNENICNLSSLIQYGPYINEVVQDYDYINKIYNSVCNSNLLKGEHRYEHK